jgi:transmembrane sensor
MKSIKMKDSEKDIIVHRFLSRETSEQENSEILHWVSVSEENRIEFRKAHQLFHQSKLKHFQSEIDVDQAWEILSGQLPKQQRVRKAMRLDVFMKMAASVLLILAVGVGSLWTHEHYFKSSKSVFVQFEAPKGEKSKIILADGSLVWLNSQTILKYDALIPRKVFVQGEAYFEVQKDQKHPFEVETASGMKVIVTGTKFNLRSFSNESVVETTLEEGEVQILGIKSDKLAVLQPGQQSTYNIQTNELQIQNVSAEIFSLWKNNELRFSDISFEDLVPCIERWYGITIKMDQKIGNNDRFTMTIKTESLRELLTMMQLTSKFNYEINGSSVEINAK